MESLGFDLRNEALLAQSDKSNLRFYSNLDIKQWIQWFLNCLIIATKYIISIN